MLEIKNVYKTFNAGTVNEKVALKGLDLTLEDGDFVTVIGGNGAGKSTMLNAVAGVWPVDMGKIIIDGKDVTRLSEHQRAGHSAFGPRRRLVEVRMAAGDAEHRRLLLVPQKRFGRFP